MHLGTSVSPSLICLLGLEASVQRGLSNACRATEGDISVCGPRLWLTVRKQG